MTEDTGDGDPGGPGSDDGGLARGERTHFVELLCEKFAEELRYVIHYRDGHCEVLYAREDGDGWTDADAAGSEEFEEFVKELGIETMERALKERRYQRESLRATIKAFDDAFELTFFLGETEGLAVGLDPTAFDEHRAFIDAWLRTIDE